MEISLLLAAFVLGLSASPNCLAICMPIMVPMITSDRDTSPKLGFLFSVYLSLGRLMVYLALAAITGYVGYTLLNLDAGDQGSGDNLILRIVMGVIAIVVLLYALSLLKGWIQPITCPKRFLPDITPQRLDNEYQGGDGHPVTETSRDTMKVRVIPVMFGLLFASIICPPYLILLGTALVSSGPGAALVAGFLFWVGTLPVNLFAGAFSGEFGRKWRKRNDDEASSFVTNVSAITLIMVGIWWLFLAFV